MVPHPSGTRRKIDIGEATRRMDKAAKRENSSPPKPYTPDLVPHGANKNAAVDEVADLLSGGSRGSRTPRKLSP